ncbi:MAG: hypothetical protein WA888_24060 [Burkholderiaceae bacterium]
MRASIRIGTSLVALAFVALVSGNSIFSDARAASSEVSDLEPKLQAQVARQKIKQRSPRSSNSAGRFNSTDDCGAVNIANNDNDKSARSRINPRNTTIVVTGPVINAAKCR